MKKIYVLDTSVYLTSSNSIYAFKSHDIAIPIKVLEEIDNHKKRQDVIGSNARHLIRILDGLREKGSLHTGVRLAKGQGIVRIINSRLATLPVDLNPDIADNKIIACALRLTQDEPTKKIILVSRDINMRVIANSLNLIAEDFNCEHAIERGESLFTGTTDIILSDEEITSFYDAASLGLSIEKTNIFAPYANEYVVLKSDEKTIAGEGRFDLKTNSIKPISKRVKPIFGIKAKNTEQNYALDLLLDVNIPIVTLIGSAGSGKTLCALAAGLEQVLQGKIYKKLIVSRPVQPVGRDIGFLPGTLEEKMMPWLRPIQDNLEFLLSGKDIFQTYIEKGIIEMEAISYIRGRSIPDTFMIIDEAQNLTVHELKTIITRVGEKTKIVLTGDIEQIDNAYIDDTSNGLSYAVEKFKTSELAGHITLLRGERSAVASLAARIL